MILGVKLLAQGITEDGDTLDPAYVVLSVSEDGDKPEVEVTLEDGSTWSIEVAVLRAAVTFAEAEEKKRVRERDA